MSTYKQQRDNRHYYVLLKDCEVLGTYGNLKKICEFMKGQDFYSYNTIIRKKDFPILYKGYKIFKVKHY